MKYTAITKYYITNGNSTLKKYRKYRKIQNNTEKYKNKKISKLNFTSYKYLHISISIHFFPGH